MHHVELVETFENIEKCLKKTFMSSNITPPIIAPINILVQFLLIFLLYKHICILETGRLIFNAGLYNFPGT